MTEGRKDELLAKISKVANSDPTAFPGVESDIKVTKDEESGNFTVDLSVHYIIENQDESDKMDVAYATARSIIRNPTS